MVREIFVSLIIFYKKRISPMLGATCRYYPTCSMYTLDAIRQRGVIVGIIMGMWRILRCNPFSKGGYDPVKIRLKGDIKWVL